MPIFLTPEHASFLALRTIEVHNDCMQNFEGLLKRHITHYQRPRQIEEYLSQLKPLIEVLKRSGTYQINAGRAVIAVADELLPALRHVIRMTRRKLAASIEADKSRTSNRELRESLDRELAPYDRLISESWFQSGAPLPPLRVSDFLALEYAQQDIEASIPLPAREYDEKFHLLQAPSLFQLDLRHFRAISELRRRPLAVGYLDIDDFKALNTQHGETTVDQNVLPAFMRCLEAEVFARGFAYRFGGDEYITLLPNTDGEGAISVLNRIRVAVAALRYVGIDRNTTMSVGFLVVEPDSMSTGQEIQQRANAAKAFAKLNGKNCIATYRANSDDLYVAVGGGASLEPRT